jgi:peroxiredoxin
LNALRISAVITAAALWGCLVGGCSSKSSSAQPRGVKADGKRNQAYDFALKDANGKTVKLSDYKGKVVLLDFWATWCGPCKIEIPWFIDLERKHKDKGFAVIGVSMDEDGWESVKPFLSQMNVNYRVVIGNDTTAQAYGGVDALPTTFLIDREGKIAATHVGLTSRKDFENGVEQLLEAPVPAAGSGSYRVALPAFALGSN